MSAYSKHLAAVLFGIAIIIASGQSPTTSTQIGGTTVKLPPGVTLSGTPAAGWLPVATSATTAVWQLFPAAPSNSPANYYISTTGNDANPCSSGSKCLTLAHALTLIPGVMTAPVTINVADGTYAESIPWVGFKNGFLSMLTILGNTSTPANVVFTGTATCVVSDGTAGYASNVCNNGGWLKLSGLTVTAPSAQGRAIFTMDAGHTIIDRVVANCPGLASPVSFCVETALSSTLEIYSPTTVNLTGTTPSGVGIFVNQGAEAIYYGDSGNGALTIAGPNLNTDTLVGIEVDRRGLFDIHLLTANQTSTVSITGVNIGVLDVTGIFVQHDTGSANPTITISHASGASGTGVYVEAGDWFANTGGIQLTNLATGFLADSSGNVAQKNCAYTNVTTHSNTSGGFACF